MPRIVSLRRWMSWKGWFYGVVLPMLRRVRPERADAVLVALGRLAGAWPPRRRVRRAAVGQACALLNASWDETAVHAGLTANLARSAARDNLLGELSDAALAARFDVSGFDAVRTRLAEGRGVILLGSHFGGYLAAIHWLSRQQIPLRLLVQRPKHVSAWLHRQFDADGRPHPQREFFLRSGMTPVEAARCTLRARDALRAGQAVLLNGDIPWTSGNARPGRLLGRTQPFLAVWADLAVLLNVPVVPVFCVHQSAGRFALIFDPPRTVEPGSEAAAVPQFLSRLETVITAYPSDAIPHLTWDAYRPLGGSAPGCLPTGTRFSALGPPLKGRAGTG